MNLPNFPPETFINDDGQRQIPRMDYVTLRTHYSFPFRGPNLPEYTVNRPSSFQVRDVQFLLSLVEHIALECVLEIGVSQGNMARILLGRFASIRWYVGVDVPNTHSAAEVPGSKDERQLRGQLAFGDARFSLLLAVGGTEALKPDVLPRNVDLVIIDADHRYAGVAGDTALAEAAARPGGLLLWHDYDPQHADVKRFLDERCTAGHDIVAFGAMAWEINR